MASVLLTRGASEQECTPPRSRYKVPSYFYKLWSVLTPTPTPKMVLCSSRARSADDEDRAGGPRRGRPPPALPLPCSPGPNLPLCDSAVAATVCRQSQRQSAGPRAPRSPAAARPNFRPPARAPSPPPGPAASSPVCYGPGRGSSAARARRSGLPRAPGGPPAASAAARREPADRAGQPDGRRRAGAARPGAPSWAAA